MKLLSIDKEKCSYGGSCPAVYDIEDGSGDVIVVGEDCGLQALHAGIDIGANERAVRISRILIEEALASCSNLQREDEEPKAMSHLSK